MFDGFLADVGSAWGVTSGEAGLILSLLGIAFLCVLLGIASGSGQATLAGGLLGIVFFIGIDWFPVWTGAIMGLVFALMFSRETVKTILK